MTSVPSPGFIPIDQLVPQPMKHGWRIPGFSRGSEPNGKTSESEVRITRSGRCHVHLEYLYACLIQTRVSWSTIRSNIKTVSHNILQSRC